MAITELPEDLNEKRLKMFVSYIKKYFDGVGVDFESIVIDIDRQAIIINDLYSIQPPRKYQSLFYVNYRTDARSDWVFSALLACAEDIHFAVDKIVEDIIGWKGSEVAKRLSKLKSFADVDLKP